MKHMQSQYQLAPYASYHIHLHDYQPQVRRMLQRSVNQSSRSICLSSQYIVSSFQCDKHI